MNHPLFLLLMTAAGLYFGWLWLADKRAARTAIASNPAAKPLPEALPGATDTPPRAMWLAVTGALVILAAETVGENLLGLSGQQSRMTWLFALYSVAGAPVIEELIFRGWLVPKRHGTTATWTFVLGASVIFSVLHPFLWKWDETGFALTLSGKGWFSSATVFATSLWLYACRLAAWNPQRSLLPCFLAHAAKNFGVVAIKAATGYMAGAW
jgi:membrane protease YdiL (CAAX protease family)